MSVFWREDKILHEFEAFIAQTAANHQCPILLCKSTEIVGIDDSFLDACGLHNPAFEPSIVDPLLHLVGSNVQGLCQTVREPVSCSPFCAKAKRLILVSPNSLRATKVFSCMFKIVSV